MTIHIIWLIIAAGVALIIYGATRPQTGYLGTEGLGYLIIGVLILLVTLAYKVGAWIG